MINNIVSDYVQPFVLSVIDFVPKLTVSIIVLILGILISRQIDRLLYNRMIKHSKDKLTVRFLSRLAAWGFMLFIAVLIMQILGLGAFANSLVAGAGVSALVIGFALKDIGENLLSGVALSFKPPFTVGDIIETNGVKGEVKSIDIRTTHIRSQEGKDIYVPNSLILKSTLTNLTQRGALRQEVALTINQSQKLDEAVTDIIKSVTGITGVVDKPEPAVLIEDYANDKVALKVYYWVNLSKVKNPSDTNSLVLRTLKSNLISKGLA